VHLDPPHTWDRTSLKQAGFHGFRPLIGLEVATVPVEHGIYVILRSDPLRTPEILASNPVTRGDVVYSLEDLQGRWIQGASVVYIGKAAGAGGLRSRLRPFSKMSVSHSGGRSIWQLEESETLIVGWTTTPDEPAGAVETAWIKAFAHAHDGRRPFANRRA